VVAGIIEAGEDPAEVARREAVEEAGCEVQDLIYMTEFVLSAGGSSETIALYCGRVQAPESGGIYGVRHEGEDIRVHVLPVAEALALLDGKHLLSAMTIIALQWLALHREELRRRWGEEFLTQARALIRAGRFFFERGWVPATSGNFSARLADQRIAITVSGRHKGVLDEDGIMVVDLDGRPLSEGKRPSAETWLHVSLYRRDPAVGAVLHTHSVNATVLSRLSPGKLRLRDYEVLKAFPGIDTHECEVAVPVFPNDQDIPRLAEVVTRYLDVHPETQGYLIAGHGFYTWGRSVEDACRHIEAFEFLFECEVLMRRLA
jgi:methylthioribulose-1-phosphate dehydratase